MSTALSDQIQVWGVEDNTIIFTDGSIGFGLELIPIDVSCSDTDEVNEIHNELVKFLNSMPSGIDMQFIQEIAEGNEKLIQENEKLCNASKSELIRELNLKKVETLKDLDSQGLIPVHKLKLIIRKPLVKSILTKKSMFSRENLFPKISEKNLKSEIHSLNKLRQEVTHLLSGTGLKISELSTDQIVTEMYDSWNPTRSKLRNVKLDSYDPSDIRDSITFTDAVLSEEGFSLGSTHHKVISLKVLPSQTFSSMASVLRSLPFDSKLFLSVKVPDQQKEIENLQTQRRLAFSMVYGKQTGVTDLESEAKFQDLEELVSELVTSGEKVFHFGLNVLLRSHSKDELEGQVVCTHSKCTTSFAPKCTGHNPSFSL